MLPDMGLIFNYQDEPRVLFNTRRPDAYEFALNKSDQNPFRQGPRPTKEYYEEDSHHQCLLPNSEKGFGNLTNDVNAFLLSSRSTQHTHDLYPILSSARLTSCFADIVVPSLVCRLSLLLPSCAQSSFSTICGLDTASRIMSGGKIRNPRSIGMSLLPCPSL
jgi:hypothetical protein